MYEEVNYKQLYEREREQRLAAVQYANHCKTMYEVIKSEYECLRNSYKELLGDYNVLKLQLEAKRWTDGK